MKKNIYRDILFGVAVGDALGVPCEFKSREILFLRPLTDMIGNGTYNLPAGTFSDDTSLTLCLAEALTQPFDIQNIANNFVDWYFNAYWTARSHVFDVGNSTRQAIKRLKQGFRPELAGGIDVSDNGNGSLMRILPLVTYIKNMHTKERYQLIRQVSSITHAHVRSVIACFYYLEFARQIILKPELDKMVIYEKLQSKIPNFLKSLNINSKEIKLFNRLFKGNIYEIEEDKIQSDGYVIHSLEASIWCLMITDSYQEAVLKAVNLGSDSDSTAAITGGLAGLLYGYDNIPEKWIDKLARNEDILALSNRWKSFESK